MNSFLRSWSELQRSGHVVRAVIVVVAVVSGSWACSSPTQFETPPEFLGLEPAFFTVSAPTSGNRIPDDSCPRALPQVVAGTRRTLSEIGATIELPSDTREIAHAFGKQPGAAFLSPTLGLIAFGYDSDLPTLLRNIGVGQQSSRSSLGAFARWCPMTINGVRATMFVDGYSVVRIATREILHGNGIVITTTSPAGRRVNIRISGASAPSNSDDILPSAAFTLAAAVAAIQW